MMWSRLSFSIKALILASLLLFLVWLLGLRFTQFLTDYGQRVESLQLQRRALTAAASFDPTMIATLDIRDTHVTDMPTYQSVLKQTVRIRNANQDVRFVYVLAPKDRLMSFLVDAEHPLSPDYSDIGEVYPDPSFYQTFVMGQPKVLGPYHDRWGVWVTGLAPICDPKTGKALALLGIDIDANRFLDIINGYRICGLTITALFMLIIVLSFSALIYQWHIQLRVHTLNKDLQNELTERKRVEERLRVAARVFENTAEGIIVTDAQGIIQSVNPAFMAITQYAKDEAFGKTPRILKSGQHDDAFYQDVWRALLHQGKWRGEFWNKRKNGEIYPQETIIDAIRDEYGTVTQYAAIFRDITERKRTEEMLRQLSATDGLTGLANRRTYDEAFTTEWQRAMRTHAPLSVIILDIDFFKLYNDTYGHGAGDECLRQVAAVLQHAGRRPGDVAARYGGEEFSLVLPLTDFSSAVAIADTLRLQIEALAIPHACSTVCPVVTVSIGVATMIPQPDTLPQELLAQADQALYRAKNLGRNRVVSSEMASA